MDHLLKGTQEARPAAFYSPDFFLLYDNVQTPTAGNVCQFDPKNISKLYQPPYSSDLAPPDYFLFPKLKIKLKALYFANVTEIKKP
jgi:hypothetical protein